MRPLKGQWLQLAPPSGRIARSPGGECSGQAFSTRPHLNAGPRIIFDSGQQIYWQQTLEERPEEVWMASSSDSLRMGVSSSSWR